MRYAQILYGKAHWIFESDEKPKFAPNIILIDVTDKQDVQEGWDYNNETGEFTPPEMLQEPVEMLSTLEEMQIEQLYQTALLEMTFL